MTCVIEVSNLCKKYNDKTILNNVSLSLDQNQTLGLVGKNGAGKSTLIKIILGFLSPTAGEVKVFGRITGNAAGSGAIGYLPEHAGYHLVFSGKEYLTLLGKMSGLHNVRERVKEVLSLVGMTSDATRRMSRYSKGMLQRIGVAQAILLNPSLLILDEPLSGLDPSGQKDLRDIIFEMQKQHKTILLCSHLLNEVERVCTRLAIIHNTSITTQGSVKELLFAGNKYVINTSEVNASLALELQATYRLNSLPNGNYLFEEKSKGQKEALLTALLSAGVEINLLSPVQQSLEEYFLMATGGLHEDN